MQKVQIKPGLRMQMMWQVAFFTRQGFLARCPVCGVMALHPRNSAGEAQRETCALKKSSGLLNSLDEADSSLCLKMSKLGYVNAQFKCKSCTHQFSRHVVIEWLMIRNKLGEDCAQASSRSSNN